MARLRGMFHQAPKAAAHHHPPTDAPYTPNTGNQPTTGVSSKA